MLTTSLETYLVCIENCAQQYPCPTGTQTEKAQNNVLAHVHRLKMAELWPHKHVRIPETCKYLTRQKGFVDVIELRILRGEMILDYLGEPNIITWVLIKMETGKSKRGDVSRGWADAL